MTARRPMVDERSSHDSSGPVLVQTEHHELTLYPDPGPFFEALEQLMAQATRRVWLETYIYRDDALGAPFAEHLVAAARRGLDVRLLYDPQGSRGARPTFFARLEERGVGVRSYRPWRLARARWTYWPRDHGRIIVVDDVAHTGGINWGREWLPRTRGGDAWHDVALGLRGPTAAHFAAVFRQRWAEAESTGGVADYIAEEAPDVQLLADSPASTSVVLTRLCAAIDDARERVWIENSYCVPPRLLLDALSSAASRGVNVQILVPGESDLPIIQTVTRGEYLDWVGSGLRVFEYQPRIMHSKFALVDDAWATVGTFNAMSPGVWWANETNVVVRDAAFVAALARVFLADVAASAPVSSARHARRPLLERVRERTAALTYRAVEWLVVNTRKGAALLGD